MNARSEVQHVQGYFSNKSNYGTDRIKDRGLQQTLACRNVVIESRSERKKRKRRGIHCRVYGGVNTRMAGMHVGIG
jgi:hypothetical protein